MSKIAEKIDKLIGEATMKDLNRTSSDYKKLKKSWGVVKSGLKRFGLSSSEIGKIEDKFSDFDAEVEDVLGDLEIDLTPR